MLAIIQAVDRLHGSSFIDFSGAKLDASETFFKKVNDGVEFDMNCVLRATDYGTATLP
jgi:hypothetical protein